MCFEPSPTPAASTMLEVEPRAWHMQASTQLSLVPEHSWTWDPHVLSLPVIPPPPNLGCLYH